jgi:mediator of RNA polymerase II transcription subunit 14
MASKLNDSVVFQPNGGGFAMRFLVTPGKPTITELFDRIQRLEFVLSIFEALQRKNINPRITSLSRLSFDYGTGQGLSASILIENSYPHFPGDLEPSILRSQTTPLCYLHMGIDFDLSSPHRRIKESFAAALNQDNPYATLEIVVELLGFTLPLLRAFDHITACHPHNPSCKVQVIARNAKIYQIRYPGLGCRFLVTAGLHRDQMRWILRDTSSDQERSRQANIASRLQERIFNAKGNSWKGLGHGAVADTDKIGSLILELHFCVTGIENQPKTVTSGNRRIGEVGELQRTDNGVDQRPPRNTAEAVDSRSAGNTSRAVGRNTVQVPSINDTGVITID